MNDARDDSDRRTGRAGLWATVIILALLVATGLIPWVGVLRGEPPAYTASVGAAVAVLGSVLLVATLRELFARREPKRSNDDARRD